MVAPPAMCSAGAKVGFARDVGPFLTVASPRRDLRPWGHADPGSYGVIDGRGINRSSLADRATCGRPAPRSPPGAGPGEREPGPHRGARRHGASQRRGSVAAVGPPLDRSPRPPDRPIAPTPRRPSAAPGRAL